MIDVVIPTYKRMSNLKTLLKSIENQSFLPKRIIVVYSGLNTDSLIKLVSEFPFKVELISSIPSVCKQRNIGIQNCTSKYICLCDDDIELPNTYFEKLYDFLETRLDFNIVTGEEYLLTTSNKWEPVLKRMSHFQLWYNYMFCLSIYSDLSLSQYQSNILSKYVSGQLLNKGNVTSKAGWPILCSFHFPIMETKIYGLGASLIRAELLKLNPYNEQLPQHGIGDNYEVAININEGKKNIAVLRDLYFKHHKSSSNRVLDCQAYFQRISELKRVVFNSKYFKTRQRLYYIWSLIGNSLYFVYKRHWRFALLTQKVMIDSIITIFNKRQFSD